MHPQVEGSIRRQLNVIQVEAVSRARLRVSVMLVAVVIAAGLTGSWVLVMAVERQQHRHQVEVMNQRVRIVESAVNAEIRRYTDTIDDLSVAISAQDDLNTKDFSTLTSTLSRERLPGVTAAVLVVPATDAQMAQVQQRWRDKGNRQLTLAPRTAGEEHLFVVLNNSLDGIPGNTGQDVRQAEEPTQALVAARNRKEVAASPTYVLLKDRELPAAKQQLSFVLVSPIYGGAGTRDAGKFRGWLLLGLRGRDFISETLQQASQHTVAVTLMDAPTADTTSPVPVAKVSGAPLSDQTWLRREVTIPVAGRTWQLVLQPTVEFAASIGPSLSVPAGSAGVLFTLLLAVLVAALSSSRNRALAKVDNATAALRADIDRREIVEAQLREREAELQRMALTDSLTGLANRRAFLDALDQAHARATRHDTQLAVLFGDVDHFKAINDKYGHAAGDAVLCEVAARLRAHFRTEDTIGRLGGDEFGIICEDFTPQAEGLLERLRGILSAPYTFRDLSLVASVSVGLARPRPGESSALLLERADATMYVTKAARTNDPAEQRN